MTKLLTVTNGPTWPGNAALPAGGTKVGTVTFRPTARLASGSDTTLGLSIADVYVDNTGALVLRGQAGPNAPFRLLGGLRAPGSVQPPTYAVEERLVIGGKAIEQRFTVTPFEDLPGGGGTWNYRSSAPDVKFVSAPPSFASDIAAVQQTVAQAQQQAQQAAASAAGSAAIVAAGANAGRRIVAGTLGMTNLLRGYTDGTAILSDDEAVRCTPIHFPNANPTPISPAAIPFLFGLRLPATLPPADPSSIWGIEIPNHPPVIAGHTLRSGFWIHRNHQAVNGGVLGIHLHLQDAAGVDLVNLMSPTLSVAELGVIGTTKVQNGVTVTVTDVYGPYSHVQATHVADRAAVRVRYYLITVSTALSASTPDRHAFFLNLTYLGHAEQPVDPYTVYSDGSEGSGGSLTRLSGGEVGVNVRLGDGWELSRADDYARFGGQVGVIGATGIGGLRQAHTVDVTGLGLTTGLTYYLPPGKTGALANWRSIPETGLPDDSLPGIGQVRIILGPVRLERGRQVLDLRQDGLDFGAPPAAFLSYRELWAGIANGTDLTTAGKITPINGVGSPSVVKKYDTTGTAAQIGMIPSTTPNTNFAVQIGYAAQNIRALAAAPSLTEGRQLVTWAVGTSDGTNTSMDGVLFGLTFSISATENYVAQFYNNLLRIERQIYSASDFSAGTTVAMTPLMTSVSVDSISLKTYHTEMVVTPENGQIRIQVYHWADTLAMPATPQVNLLVAATGTGRFGYTLRQQYLRLYKIEVVNKATGTTNKAFT